MTLPYPPLWSIWPEIGILAKLCIIIPALVGFYILVSVIFILIRLRSLTTPLQFENPATLSHAVARLVIKSNNLRNLLQASFYLFGFTLFASFPWAFFTIENSKRPISMIVLNNLDAQFSVAANAFLIFLVLHCVQWFVSGRVRAIELRLKAPL